MQGAINNVADYWFDLKYGTDTASFVNLHEVSVVGTNRERGRPYQPSRMRPFTQLMRRLNLPEGSVFVDVGCGKGKPLLMAAQHGFKRVVGIEFSPQLCEVAVRNIAKYWAKNGIDLEYEIALADVTEYRFKDDENVFYLFNPFGAPIIRSFLNNLEDSRQRRPRQMWLIYHNPAHRELVDLHGSFTRLKDYKLGQYEYAVYITRS